MRLDSAQTLLRDTPLVRLPVALDIELHAKLEFTNPTGSIKDRAAAYILDRWLADGRVTKSSTIIESSSGNFGIALSVACRYRGLRFCCVIDPRINRINETLIRSMAAEVIKVDRIDPTGGYLQTRIKTVKQVIADRPDTHWVDQYGNPLNAEVYETKLCAELVAELPRIDYAFVGVSSGGTITGVSRGLKARFPDVKIIAVDTVGSVIFGGAPVPRWIPGIGASVRPKILDHAKIDDVVLIEESDTVEGCRALWQDQMLLAGGSSGTVYCAIHKYFTEHQVAGRPSVLAILADRGDRYADTIFNDGWVQQLRDGTLRRSVYPPPPPLPRDLEP